MNLGDDLITAGVSAGVGGTAALWGAWIGAKATRRASAEAFDRAASREDAAWRKALHRECLQNINLNQDLGAEELWSFDTRVLRDCPTHAGAFSPTVLQRIIWARTANEQLEVALDHLRKRSTVMSVVESWKEAVKEHRSRVIGEISAIEVELRT